MEKTRLLVHQTKLVGRCLVKKAKSNHHVILCNTGERMQKSSRQSVKLKRCERGAALFLWVTIEIYRVIRWKFNSLPQPHGNLYPHTAQHCLALKKSRNVLKIIKIGMYVNCEMHLTSWPVSISRFNYIWKVLLKM